MFHLRFGLSDHLKALRDFVFGSRRRVKKVRIFRAWFSQGREVFFFSNAFVTCFWYHGNRNGHSTSLGEKAKGDDAVIKKTLCFTMVKI